MSKHAKQALSAGVASAVALALSGCINLAPRYQSPPLPVAASWPIAPGTAGASGASAASDASDEAGTAPAGAGTQPAAAPATAQAADTAVADIGWRDFFVDTRLQRLIELALQNNRDLRVAVLNVERARGQYQVQRADRLPSVDASGGFTRQRLPAVESATGVPVTTGTVTAAVGVSAFELDLFSRVRNLSQAALEQYFAEESARRSTQLALISQVATAYLGLAADQQLLTLAQDTLRSQEQSFELTRKQHSYGAVSGLDLAQAQTTVESARADVARYAGNVARDTDALTLLVGTTVAPALLPAGLTGTTVAVSGLAPLPAGLPSQVLLRRPDVLQAEHVLRGADADIGAARAAFFPSISLTANTGFASTQLSGLFDAPNRSWSFSPGINLPIFEGGRLRGNLRAAKASRDIALAQYEEAIQTGFREVADALALTQTLAQQLQAQQALAAATHRAFELSQERYKRGLDSYLTVLDSQRADYAAQQTLISTQLSEQSNRITLYQVLGGGWLERGRPAAP